MKKIIALIMLLCFFSNFLYCQETKEARALLRGAIDAFNAAQSKEAKNSFIQVLNMEGNDDLIRKVKINAYFWLSFIALEDKDENESREWFRKMLKEFPESATDFPSLVWSQDLKSAQDLLNVYKLEKGEWLNTALKELDQLQKKMSSQQGEIEQLKKKKGKGSVISLIITIALIGIYAGL